METAASRVVAPPLRTAPSRTPGVPTKRCHAGACPQLSHPCDTRPVDEVHIRRATLDDADAASTIMVDARHASVPAIPAPTHSDAQIRVWVRDVVFVEHDVWVALDGDRILAVMVLADGWIEHLYVAPGWTGRGTGARLVRHAQGRARGPLDLWTFASNIGAARFYERHGFVPVDRTNGDNEEGEPDIRYRWTPPS